jgi:hypothetical protein
MYTPHDPTHPESSPAAKRRRRRQLAASATAITVAVVAGATYVLVASRQPTLTVPETARIGTRSPDRLVPVRGHSKMQAHGTNWSQRRPIEIAPYLRGVAAAT